MRGIEILKDETLINIYIRKYLFPCFISRIRIRKKHFVRYDNKKERNIFKHKKALKKNYDNKKI